MIEKIFTWVWRINGLLILGVTLITLGFILFEIFEENYEPERITTNIAEDPQGTENWVLGEPSIINGTENIYIPLVSENSKADSKKLSSRSFYKESYEGFYKNLLFINRTNNKMHWLFEDVDQFIERIRQLPYREYDEDPADAQLILYRVYVKDSNNDEVISSEDDHSLAYSLPDGTEFSIILEDYEKILSTKLLDNGTLSVIYQKSGLGIMTNYSLNPFKELSRIELPNVGD